MCVKVITYVTCDKFIVTISIGPWKKCLYWVGLPCLSTILSVIYLIQELHLWQWPAPNLFDTRDLFHGRQFFHEPGEGGEGMDGFGMIQVR